MTIDGTKSGSRTIQFTTSDIVVQINDRNWFQTTSIALDKLNKLIYVPRAASPARNEE